MRKGSRVENLPAAGGANESCTETASPGAIVVWLTVAVRKSTSSKAASK